MGGTAGDSRGAGHPFTMEFRTALIIVSAVFVSAPAFATDTLTSPLTIQCEKLSDDDSVIARAAVTLTSECSAVAGRNYAFTCDNGQLGAKGIINADGEKQFVIARVNGEALTTQVFEIGECKLN